MTQENAEVIRAAYAAWCKRDLDAVLETLDPKIEFHSSGLFPDLAPIYRGHEGMRSLWEAMFAPWESLSLEVERIVEGEECAAVALRFHGQGKSSGARTDLPHGHALRFEDGRVVRISAHPSFEDALKAAGLRECAMSQEDIELPYRAVDAFNRRDLNAFLALVDPDVEFTPLQAEMEGGGSYRGHEGVRRWWENLLSVFPDFSVEINEVRSLGAMTVTRLRLRGQGMESDTPMEQTDWQATEWRDKKAIWWRTFRSEAEALEAAGLRG